MSRLGHSFLPLSFTQRSVARDEGAIFVENEGNELLDSHCDWAPHGGEPYARYLRG